MKIKTLIALSLLASTSGALATTVNLDLGPNRFVHGDLLVLCPDLNGTQLNGDPMSIDLNFEQVHLLNSTSRQFLFVLAFDTDVDGTIVWPASTTFLLDQNGNQIGATSFQPQAGSGTGNDIGFVAGHIFPFHTDINGVTIPGTLDFFGSHTDFMLPDITGGMITGAEILFNADPPNNLWRVGAFPDTGATLSLLALSILAILALRSRVHA